MNKYLTTAEVAALLRTNPQVIRESRCTGMLFDYPAPNHYKLSRNKILYSEKELLNYLSNIEPEKLATPR